MLDTNVCLDCFLIKVKLNSTLHLDAFYTREILTLTALAICATKRVNTWEDRNTAVSIDNPLITRSSREYAISGTNPFITGSRCTNVISSINRPPTATQSYIRDFCYKPLVY